MAKKALGKGLGAIFGDDYAASGSNISTQTNLTNNEENVSRETLTLRISQIEPNRKQPRQMFEESSLAELAESIKKVGILQPLIVKKTESCYEIVAGERRWRAAKLAGLKEVPVIIKDLDKGTAAEIAIIENIQREDLNPLEEAKAYKTLMDEYGLTQEEVAAKVSKDRSTVANSLRLLALTDHVAEMLLDGRLSAGHARTLAAVKDEAVQSSLADRVIAEELSVRKTEELVKGEGITKKRTQKKDIKQPDTEDNLYCQETGKRLTDILGTKVTIKNEKDGSGTIEIKYFSKEALNGLIEKLS